MLDQTLCFLILCEVLEPFVFHFMKIYFVVVMFIQFSETAYFRFIWYVKVNRLLICKQANYVFDRSIIVWLDLLYFSKARAKTELRIFVFLYRTRKSSHSSRYANTFNSLPFLKSSSVRALVFFSAYCRSLSVNGLSFCTSISHYCKTAAKNNNAN